VEKNIVKIVVAVVAVALIAYFVASKVSAKTLTQHKQKSASKTWQSSVTSQPMADEAFVNYRRG
jgi:hypothetical protein